MNLKILIIKSLDAIIGRFLCHLLPRPNNQEMPQISRILVIRPGGIGDAVLLLPSLAAVKKLLPEAEIHILAEQRNYAVFELSPHVSSIYCYDNPLELFRVVRGSYDVVIDTEQWHRLSAVITRLTGAPILVGFGTNERKRLLNISVAYSHNDHETTSFDNLFRAVFKELPEIAYQECISIPEKATHKIQSIIQPQIGLSGSVALFTGASIPEKRWPVQSWRILVERLSTYGLGIVMVGGKDVEGLVNPITNGLSVVNVVGQLSLMETAAILKNSQLLVSGDSGLLHLAWLVETPTVSLFGPSNAVKWAPRGEKHLLVSANRSCSPCSEFGTTPPCPINALCIREITVDEVFDAVTMLLNSIGAMSSRCCKRDWIEIG